MTSRDIQVNRIHLSSLSCLVIGVIFILRTVCTTTSDTVFASSLMQFSAMSISSAAYFCELNAFNVVLYIAVCLTSPS